ncbi:UNVERIFIED_CONTAM: hypothetical protein GTU68_064331 [Idotea baltica]|nr:hypothetical protein [Idotea baltica]
MNLTQREKEIVHLVANELTTKEIATHLFISDHTVISHRKNLMEKLQVKNTAGLIRKAFDVGLLRIAMIILVALQLPFLGVSQERSIGLEVDKAHDVSFGAPLDSVGNSFYWASDKGTIIVGSDDLFAFPNTFELDSIGLWSAVFGIENKMHGNASIAWGVGNHIEFESVNNTAFGTANKISVPGSGSTVWGSNNLSDGPLSTIWGAYNVSNSSTSTIWGINNISNGVRSSIWGENNNTDNTNTTAFGEDNRAGGYASTVMGIGNVAKGYAALVTGTYCDTILHADHDGLFDSTPLFVIGNGRGVNPNPHSNALTVFGSGRMKLGSGTAESDLHIKQSESTIDGGSGGIRFDKTPALPESEYWQIYNSGSHFSFAKNGTRRAYITAAGAYVDDESFAPDNADVTKSKKGAKNDILKVDILSSSLSKKKTETKINAHQILIDFPDLIINDEKGDPFGIDYKQLYLLAISALQDEIKTNEKQQLEIDKLKAAILK